VSETEQGDEILHAPAEAHPSHLLEVGLLFFTLGWIAFGGPAAHIALMREECVKRRKWLSEERFLDLFGAVNLIPGPSSTQLAIYLGYLRAGWPGLFLAGACFIVPAMAIVLAIAWAYVTYQALPQVGWLLYGVKPVVIAVIAQAIVGLGRTALRGALPVIYFLTLLALYLLGVNILVVLFGGAFVFAVLRLALSRLSRSNATGGATLALVTLGLSGSIGRLRIPSALRAVGRAALPVALAVAAPVTLLTLFLTFLKLGAVVYGSGYTLLAFIRDDFVLRLHWLTEQQALDAISIGQVTPGPVFTTATFIGYLVLGWQGALVATLGIFLPSFLFVPFIHLAATRLRSSQVIAAALAGANIAALALMTGVSLQLARAALVDLFTWGVALLSLLILLRYKVNPIWLILLSAAASVAAHFLALV
jgi:chromate transporter